jgi:hypothetical protein
MNEMPSDPLLDYVRENQRRLDQATTQREALFSERVSPPDEPLQAAIDAQIAAGRAERAADAEQAQPESLLHSDAARQAAREGQLGRARQGPLTC